MSRGVYILGKNKRTKEQKNKRTKEQKNKRTLNLAIAHPKPLKGPALMVTRKLN